MSEGQLCQLPVSTVKLLASSQVITSVSSVVKELVENSLDAGAKNVQVRLENYGLDLIEVKDDGSGVSFDNVQKMFLSGYTSKIREFNDLENLESYGFRGEALSAIAKTGDVTVTTKTEKDTLAMTYTISPNGEPISSKPSHLNKGTIISVLNLFNNLPVRKQYMSNKRRAVEELKKVEHVVQALAVVHPELRMALIHNKCSVWQKNAVGVMKQSFMQIIGLRSASKMVHLNETKEDITLDLIIPRKDLEEIENIFTSSSQPSFVHVNKRPVHNKYISKVVTDHISKYFSRFNVSHKVPVSLVSVTIPSSEIDVNLEPNKTKVLLKNKEEVLAFLDDTLAEYYEQSIDREITDTSQDINFEEEDREVKRFKPSEEAVKKRRDDFLEKNQDWSLDNVSTISSQINRENCVLTTEMEVCEMKEKLSQSSVKLVTQFGGTSLVERLKSRDDIQSRREGERDDIPSRREGERDDIQSRREGERDDIQSRRKGERDDIQSRREGERDDIQSRREGERDDIQSRREGERDDIPSRREGERDDIPSRREGERDDIPSRREADRDDIPSRREAERDDISSSREGERDDIPSRRVLPDWPCRVSPVKSTKMSHEEIFVGINERRAGVWDSVAWSKGLVELESGERLEGGVKLLLPREKEENFEKDISLGFLEDSVLQESNMTDESEITATAVSAGRGLLQSIVAGKETSQPTRSESLSSIVAVGETSNVSEDEVAQFDLSMRSVSSQMGKKEHSAFTKFARIMRPKIIEEFPNILFTRVAGLLVDRWTALSKDEKRHYEQLSKVVDLERKLHQEKKAEEQKEVNPLKTMLKKIKSRRNEKRPTRSVVVLKASLEGVKRLEGKERRGAGETTLIGQLRPSGNWLYARGDVIGHVRHVGLEETVIYQRMMNSHIVPSVKLPKPIPLTPPTLSPSSFSLLTSPPLACDSDVLLKNGFVVEVEGSSAWLVGVAAVVPQYGVPELEEALNKFRVEGEMAGVAQWRPTAIENYITNEAVRMSHESPCPPDRLHLEELLGVWSLCLGHLQHVCLHGKDIFVPIHPK